MSLDHQLIGSYSHLPNMPRPQHALYLLRKVANLVKPIMLQRSFRVGSLVEMYPAQENLYGLNYDKGASVHLRLRMAGDPHTFLQEEVIVNTMLHELTHNVFGPHDEKFYGLLKELERDYYSLQAKGWRGEGFYSDGKRLGGRILRRTSLDGARKRALEAVERRRRTLTAESGRRLGGASARPTADIPRHILRQQLASAVDRRNRDAQSCGQGHKELMDFEEQQARRNGFRTKAEEDDANDEAILKATIELIEQEGRGWNERDGVVWIEDAPAAPETSGSWECTVCTLVNKEPFLQCDACGMARETSLSTSSAVPVRKTPPTDGKPVKKPFLSKASQDILAKAEEHKAPKTWTCHMCSTKNEEMWWTCQVCGVMKLKS
jgi:rubrerythrin